MLPDGKRRETLHASLEQRVFPLFACRVLSFDARTSQARGAGKAMSPADGYISAIAATHRLVVAARDTGPFEAAGLRVINPRAWQR